MSKIIKRVDPDTIVKKIFDLENCEIDNSRLPEISNFITAIINNDLALKFLVMPFDNEAHLYILTNFRIIKMNINYKKIESASFLIRDIKETRVIKYMKEKNVENSIIFSDGSTLGARYCTDEVCEFFRAVDDLRVKKNNY